MVTERLYFADAYLTQFTARVVARATRNGLPALALDQSAFYPESGGQPADHGTLNGVAVRDVQIEDGVVWHMLEQPLEDETVHGIIDWARRFDHMQQHHGQHLLSAAFEQLFGMRTLSFHLGATSSTIDLDTTALSNSQAAEVEELVNQVIWEDRPVLARFVTPEELATLPLRKPPKVTGAIRVVSVPNFDHSACGGTHPRATGGVGLLHLRRWDRRGDVLRVEFLCGGRALRDLRWKNASLARIAASFSVAAEESEEAIARLRDAEERARKRLEEANGQLLQYEAQRLLQGAQRVGELSVVRQAFENRDLNEIRTLAKAITAGGGVAVLGLRAEKTQLLVSCAEGMPLDCGAIVRKVLTPLGGRGGGQRALAQGSVPDPAQLDAALDAAIEALASS